MIKSYKLGPGTLTLGAVPLNISAQLTSAKVNPSEAVTTTDAIKVLSGEELAGEDTATYSFTLEGTLLQDLDTAGVVDWSWENMGTEQAFTFTPNTVEAATVTGTLTPVPLVIGGDVSGPRPTSDFVWRIKGTPTFTPA